MSRDVTATTQPDVRLLRDAFEKPCDGGRSKRVARDTAVQANRHHLRLMLAFVIEDVKLIAENLFEIAAGCHRAPYEFRVVRYLSVGHHQMVPVAA